MNIAHFLSRLPKILDPIKSQILASQDLSSLSEVFGRLRPQHYMMTIVQLHSLLLVVMHYLLVINLPLPLLWGVIEVVMEVEAMEVMTKKVVGRGMWPS